MWNLNPIMGSCYLFFFCRNVFFSCVERGHWPAVKVYTLNQKEITKCRVKSWTREEKEKLSVMIFCAVCSRMSKHWKGCFESSELTETSREREWTCICWTHVQENTVSVLAAASKKKQKVFDKTCRMQRDKTWTCVDWCQLLVQFLKTTFVRNGQTIAQHDRLLHRRAKICCSYDVSK